MQEERKSHSSTPQIESKYLTQSENPQVDSAVVKSLVIAIVGLNQEANVQEFM